jgi:hypothetical protein
MGGQSFPTKPVEHGTRWIAQRLPKPWQPRAFRLRTQAINGVRDLIDRHIRGFCCDCPQGSGKAPGGGYRFWRCARRRGHRGRHRSINYVWDDNGVTEHVPIDQAFRVLDLDYPREGHRLERL